MTDFPRTNIENLSVSRLMVGTNWFLGYSHTSKSRDALIKKRQTREKIADILEVCFAAGVDTLYGCRPESPHLEEAIKDAEDRTGRTCVKIGTPHMDLSGTPQAEGENKRTIEGFAKIGCHICMPHQATTDALVNRRTFTIDGMDRYVAMIREAGMLPGLSTHMPESIVYADGSGLDVATYIQIYNAIGFLMQVEVDWVHRIIWEAKKPVITIKPMAAGRLLPLPAFAFVWSTLREQDMVTAGFFTPDEAKEVIELSLNQLHGRGPSGELQKSRSKMSLVYE